MTFPQENNRTQDGGSWTDSVDSSRQPGHRFHSAFTVEGRVLPPQKKIRNKNILLNPGGTGQNPFISRLKSTKAIIIIITVTVILLLSLMF